MTKHYPRRSRNHQIGDQAKGQIMNAFFSNGWIVEEVQEDYGEDLVLQIVVNEQVLPFRIFIQLKGTEKMQKFKRKDHYIFSNLKSSTALHWLDSNDLTTFVLWDIKKRQGVFDFTDHAIKRKHVDNPKRKTVSAKLPERNMIKEKDLEGFKKVCLENYLHKRHMYLEGLKATFVVEKKDKKYRSSIAAINTQIVDMVLLYLNNIGIIEISKSGNYISTTEEFRDMMIEDITPQLEKIEDKSVPKKEIEMMLQAGIMATIIHWHGKKYNHPIHENILIPLADVLIAINDHIIQSVKKIYEKKSH